MTNPIEHACSALKKQALKMFPEIMDSTGKSEEDRKNLEEALKGHMGGSPLLSLSLSLFESLIESMRWRIEACIAANGWHTKSAKSQK